MIKVLALQCIYFLCLPLYSLNIGECVLDRRIFVGALSQHAKYLRASYNERVAKLKESLTIFSIFSELP